MTQRCCPWPGRYVLRWALWVAPPATPAAANPARVPRPAGGGHLACPGGVPRFDAGLPAQVT
ncbi:hypothetical protein ACWDV4_15835 [Micromonospora sp. NPDC003197]